MRHHRLLVLPYRFSPLLMTDPPKPWLSAKKKKGSVSGLTLAARRMGLLCSRSQKDPDVASRVVDVSCQTSTKHRMNDGWNSSSDIRASKKIYQQPPINNVTVRGSYEIHRYSTEMRTCRIDDNDSPTCVYISTCSRRPLLILLGWPFSGQSRRIKQVDTRRKSTKPAPARLLT